MRGDATPARACQPRAAARGAEQRRIGLRGLGRAERERLAAEVAERALAAGEHQDLQIARLPGERVEHPLDARVVGVDHRVVQDHRRAPTGAGQHPREGEADQQRDLLLRAPRERVDRLLGARPRQRRGRDGIGVEAEFGVGQHEAQERRQLAHHRLDVALARVVAGGRQGDVEPLQGRHLEPERVATPRRRGQALLGVGERLVHGLGGVMADRGVEARDLLALLRRARVGRLDHRPSARVGGGGGVEVGGLRGEARAALGGRRARRLGA
ncbi:MAG: hypothetical protein ACFBWO_14770, partial [Paracoccaceae bacterium]